ncbi:ribonuclease HI [Actinorugispora endophytica]|uniref:RNase H superfamily protein n=1 Tax=Actinorugispora endophytica TaxID=1605990 RepID=A0A4V3D7T4_9ACTN|nr:RNase H family protein [Actinorugispora endophytica]TDQ48817.1 RNase H superfamily protein [Actinorugispora endophytica]
MAPDEFDACAECLPPELADRITALRRYVVYSPHGPRRRSVAEAVSLAFDAAYVGDLAAAAAMTTRAEERNAAISAQSSTRILSGYHGVVRRWEGAAPLVAATDASVKGPYAGMGYVTSDGRWGMRSWNGSTRDPSGPSRVLVQELRAVSLLLQALDPGATAVLLVDSAVARRYLRAWQRGGERPLMPAGYEDGPRRANRRPTLVRLAEEMAARPGLTVEPVKGHSGDLLNETADSLASMARRRLADPRSRGTPELIAHADAFVASFLRQWHADLSRWA